MIKYFCDMCGDDLYRDQVVTLSFDSEFSFLTPGCGNIQLCSSCAARARSWITSQPKGDTK